MGFSFPPQTKWKERLLSWKSAPLGSRGNSVLHFPFFGKSLILFVLLGTLGGCFLFNQGEDLLDVSGSNASHQPPPVTLFYTRNMRGFIDLCGCSPDQRGGWPRIASIRKETSEGIWVDGGGWIPEHSDPVPEVTHSLFEWAFSSTKYDVVLWEPEEGVVGSDAIPRLKSGDGKDGGGETMRVGDHFPLTFFALASLDREEALRGVIALFPKRVVLLSRLTEEENRELLERHPNLLYLIGDAPEERAPHSSRWSPPLFPFGGEVGRVVFPGGEATRILVNDEWVDDEEMVAGIREVREEGFSDRIPTQSAQGVVSEVCSQCHSPAWETWKDSSHASAWQTMVAERTTLRPDCVGCHTTGWQIAELSYQEENVGCIACHVGQSDEHVKNPVAFPMESGGLSSCVVCHRPDHSTLFSPRGYWPPIAH